jgi:hypothetical protein
VPGIEVGTAVVQTYPKHPLALAGQALTARAISGNAFTLGLGPSHREIIEGTFGLDYDRPARHVREYLSALMPLLRGEAVDYLGATLSVTGQITVPGATPPPVLLSALGPVMLRIAGELADGTVTVWTGPRAVAEHIVPRITEAARTAGRPAPRVVASAMVAITNDPGKVRRRIAEQPLVLGYPAGFLISSWALAACSDSTRTSYLSATSELSETKSRLPPWTACAIRPKIAPATAPQSRPHRSSVSQAPGRAAKIPKNRPMSRPNQAPLSAPQPAARRYVMRATTCSTDRRPTPTISVPLTGKPWSDR